MFKKIKNKNDNSYIVVGKKRKVKIFSTKLKMKNKKLCLSYN